MTEQSLADGDREDGDGEGDAPPAYRVSHLMDDLADVFSDRLELVAPMKRGGVKPRVNNRATFTLTGATDSERREVEDTLDRHGFQWTTGEPGEYIVLGRAITDLRELREGDRIYLNARGGPFRVFSVLKQPAGPEVLQRSDPSVTVEVTNADTGTDWMVVQWDGEPEPWAYVRTKDQHASGGYRYRKVEPVERSGRIGPRRLFALAPQVADTVEGEVPDLLDALTDAAGSGVFATDAYRVQSLFSRPIPDLFTAADAATVREVLLDLSEWFNREANALEVETDSDKERVARQQDAADLCEDLASAFGLQNMDAVDVSEDADDLYVHDACGQAFTDRFAYSKHCGLCDEGDDNEDADPATDGGPGETEFTVRLRASENITVSAPDEDAARTAVATAVADMDTGEFLSPAVDYVEPEGDAWSAGVSVYRTVTVTAPDTDAAADAAKADAPPGDFHSVEVSAVEQYDKQTDSSDERT